jgi:hypothetical protein
MTMSHEERILRRSIIFALTYGSGTKRAMAEVENTLASRHSWLAVVPVLGRWILRRRAQKLVQQAILRVGELSQR